MPDPIRELCEIVARHTAGRRRVAPLRGVTFLRATARTEPADAMYRPTLCVALQGRKRVVCGRQTFSYGSESYLLATVDVPVRGCVLEASPDRPYLGLTFDLDLRRLAEVLLEMPRADRATERSSGIVESRMDADLADALARLARLADRPADAPVLQPLLEREICYRLLSGERGATLRQAATAGTHLAAIAAAAAWIAAHYAEPWSVDALAATAGMSPTSFHRHFKAVIAMSPLQYRTNVRLQEARRRMIASGLDAGAIGQSVGYESASQFSREYRRLFGVPPAADAARLRSEVRANRTRSEESA